MKDNTPQDITAAGMTPEHAMQEQLCSYLFGELGATEAAHVEARIAESAVWRDEHDRLKGTIGLVESTLKTKPEAAQPALSAASMQTLADAAKAASGKTVLPFAAPQAKRSPIRFFAPIAAGLAVTFGGVLAWKAIENGEMAPDGFSAETLDSQSANYQPETLSSSERALPGRTFRKDQGGARAETETASEQRVNQALEASEYEARMSSLMDEADAPEESIDAGEAAGLGVSALKVLEEPEEEASPTWNIRHNGEIIVQREQLFDSNESQVAPMKEVKAKLSRLANSAPPQSGGSVDDPLLVRGDANVLHVSPGAPETRSTSAATGSEDWLLGKGAAAGARDKKGAQEEGLAQDPAAKVAGRSLGQPQANPATKPDATQLRYKGPSDVVPPGAGGGSRGGTGTPGPNNQPARDSSQPVPPGGGGGTGGGPSTPGLSGPGSPGPVTGGVPAVKAPAAGAAIRPSAVPEEESVDEDQEATDGYYFDDASEDSLRERKRQRDADGEEDLGRFERSGRLKAEETPEQLELRLRADMEARAQARYAKIIRDCLPRPKESPRDMYYRYWGDNPFVYTSTDKLATFAADVDTASYTLARRYLVENMVPTKAQVRTEEFVNYFAGDIPAPTEDVFNVQTEATVSPFGGSTNRYMLRVGVRGKVIPKENRPPMSLVFVVDTSGSMEQGNRMDLVKHSLRLLGTELDGRDQVGIVSFASTANLVLPMTSMDQRGTLETAIQSLDPEGSTNVEDGMRLGYELLSRIPAKDNELRRVVLISDGVANTGQTTADAILAQVDVHKNNGIYLSTVGVGMGNHNDALLERLANRGNGICDYVDDAEAARRAMVDRFSGGFIPIARDLKIQVEFDGKYVLRYRQLGYENRAVADQDFRNDAVDGGEVGSGHQVTALFELDCVDLPEAAVREALEMGKVRLRYKTVYTGSDEQVFETEHAIVGKSWNKAMEAAQPGFQRAMVAAQFAETLRQSTHAANDDFGHLVQEANRIADLPDFAQDADTKELRDMIQRAGALGVGQKPRLTELEATVDHYKKHRFLCETERQVRGPQTSERLEEIARLNAELEARIRDLCLQEAQSGR